MRLYFYQNTIKKKRSDVKGKICFIHRTRSVAGFFANLRSKVLHNDVNAFQYFRIQRSITLPDVEVQLYVDASCVLKSDPVMKRGSRRQCFHHT